MTSWQESSTADETMTYGRRLRDLEAQAFRTARTLAKHREQLATIRDHQHTAFGHTDPLSNAIGTPGEHTIEQRLGTIQHILSALARAQDIDPETIG